MTLGERVLELEKQVERLEKEVANIPTMDDIMYFILQKIQEETEE